MKKQKWILIGSLVLVFTTTAYLWWRKPKRNKTAKSSVPKLTPGQTSDTKIVTEPNWELPFDMNYAKDVAQWLAPKEVKTLNWDKALHLVTKLKTAKGRWYTNDNEAAVYDVFAKQLQDKVEVANLAKVFWQRYKLDMWEYLNSFLSKREMESNVHEPVRKLAPYTIT